MDSHTTSAVKQSVVESAPGAATRRRRGVRLAMIAVLLEMMLILPFVDHLADTHPTIHFTQHGLIFLGGILFGLAIRDVHGTRAADR